LKITGWNYFYSQNSAEISNLTRHQLFLIMETISQIFGEGKDLATSQMCARAAIIFLVTLLLIRLSGRRSFGMHYAFDNIIVILLGAILSRTIVGASAFIPTVSAALVIVLMHRGFAWLGLTVRGFNRVIKGDKIILYEDGQLLPDNLKRALISEKDLEASLRTTLQEQSLANIKCAYMECNGEISFVKKD
jgi:uncharacterized membrane protein YcaP (DUF421 family)